MKKQRAFTGFVVIALLAVITYFFVSKVSKKELSFHDISRLEATYKLDAKTVIDLIKEEDVNFLKPEQVVEIDGVIKKINYMNNRITILLGSGNIESTFVICDMERSQSEEISRLSPKDTIKLKGVFKGFLEDAIFLNCVISK